MHFYQVPKSREWLSERVNNIHGALTALRVKVWIGGFQRNYFPHSFLANSPKCCWALPKLIFIPDDILFLVPFEMLSPEVSKGTFSSSRYLNYVLSICSGT